MQEKIIEFLKKKEGYVSGDHLSQRMGMSRQALWKHIQQLRDSGYEIMAVPHLGYHLASVPDRLFPFEVTYNLKTDFIGRSIHYFDTVGSTMDIGLQLGFKSAAEGTLVLAEAQTKGKGRLGRQWFSPRYKGIYFSLLLRPKIAPGSSPMLTLMAAVSICEAVKEATGLSSQIKWPNDILLNNKKLGGILTELNAELDIARFLVIGAGLNVNNDKKTLLPGATSLKEHAGETINRVNLLQEILSHIEDNYLLFQKKGAGAIADKWRDYNVTLGRRVRVSLPGEHIEGEALDIDEDGGLVLRTDAGILKKLTSGDVVHCR